MTESIAAVVVTYNRSRLLLECLDALLRQTRPVDRIVLIDNASSDNTVELLKSRGYLDNSVIVYARLSTNTGGAGGFYAGMKMAHDLGVDWIWIMDDDAEPLADALAKMEPSFSIQNIGGVTNLTIGLDDAPQIEHRGWLNLCSTNARAHRVIDPRALTPNMRISFASFVGLAVHRSAIDRIGLPKREFFFRGDDLEYCVRLATLGPLILVPESKIRHKDGIIAASKVERRRRFGYESNRVPIDKLWPNYFSLRNLVWIRRRYCGNAIAAGFAARHVLRRALGIILFDTHRMLRFRFYWSAIADAWGDVFDNEKARNLTRVTPPTANPPGRI